MRKINKLFKLKKPRLKTKPPKVINHNKIYNRKKNLKLNKQKIMEIIKELLES